MFWLPFKRNHADHFRVWLMAVYDILVWHGKILEQISYMDPFARLWSRPQEVTNIYGACWCRPWDANLRPCDLATFGCSKYLHLFPQGWHCPEWRLAFSLPRRPEPRLVSAFPKQLSEKKMEPRFGSWVTRLCSSTLWWWSLDLQFAVWSGNFPRFCTYLAYTVPRIMGVWQCLLM